MSLKRLCVILFSSGLLTLAQEQASSFSNGPIIVWKVGSPYRGDTPDTSVPLELKLKAEKIGSGIKVEVFPAKGFSQIFFEAFEAHQEPDILVFNNYGILEGITTNLGELTGINSNPTVRNALIEMTGSLKDFIGGQWGWQFLIATSKHHQAAMTLALQSPECDASLASEFPPSSDLQSLSQRISHAFLEQSGSLKAYEDGKRLVAEGVRRGPLQVLETKTCGYWGNDHLAFVSLLSSYQSAKRVGQIPVLLVLRKQDDDWRLLAASTDPISNTRFLEQIRPLAGMLQGLWNQHSEPQPAELLSPKNGQFPSAKPGRRFGDFSWLASPSEAVVAEIAEFAYQNDARLSLRLRTKGTTFEQLSAGELWTSHSEWKWRVWSISDTGAISFSPVRTFPH